VWLDEFHLNLAILAVAGDILWRVTQNVLIAQFDAANQEAGIPPRDLYVHQDGANWDFMLIQNAENTPEQSKKLAEALKKRGLPGWVDKTEGSKVTLTLFSGDTRTFKQTWSADFAMGKDGGKLCVTNDELRTWNPPVDGERYSIVDAQNVPADSYGCSGLRLTVSVTNMLEGFRKGRVVRIIARTVSR